MSIDSDDDPDIEFDLGDDMDLVTYTSSSSANRELSMSRDYPLCVLLVVKKYFVSKTEHSC